MAQSIKCVVEKITANPVDLKAVVTIRFTDTQGHVWKKDYPVKMTDDISVAQFKNVLIADLTRDLKPKSNLAALEAYVGKEFTISI